MTLRVVGRNVVAGGTAVPGDSYAQWRFFTAKNVSGTPALLTTEGAATFIDNDTPYAGVTVTIGAILGAVTITANDVTGEGTTDWEIRVDPLQN
jgi:hypothetical protein